MKKVAAQRGEFLNVHPICGKFINQCRLLAAMAYRGEAHFQVDDANLSVQLWQPNGPSKGSITFSPGFTGIVERDSQLLNALGESFTVAGINFRGHGRSGGLFDARRIGEDLASARKAIFAQEPVVHVGHSMGATAAILDAPNAAALVLLAPYLGIESLKGRDPYLRIGISTEVLVADAIARSPFGDGIEALLQKLPPKIYKGIFGEMHHPVRGSASVRYLSNQHLPTANTQTLLLLPGRDEMLRVRGQAAQQKYASAVGTLLKNCTNASHLCADVNHAFNSKPYDWQTLLKPSPSTSNIIAEVHAYIEKQFELRS